MGARTGGRRLDPVVILTLGLVVLAFLHVLTGTLPAARDLRRMRDGNARARETLREETDTRKALEDRRDGLREDPQTVERELRRTLNMIRRDETMVVPPDSIRR